MGAMTISERLRAAREAAGLTREQAVADLAVEGLHITVQTLYRWEREGDSGEPRATDAAILAKVYDVELADLIPVRRPTP